MHRRARKYFIYFFKYRQVPLKKNPPRMNTGYPDIKQALPKILNDITVKDSLSWIVCEMRVSE